MKWSSVSTGGPESGYGAFTLDVKSVLNENLGGNLGGTQYLMGDSLKCEMNVILT
jgi:hypothetical protein